SNRFIGMIQPRKGKDNEIFKTGCAGKITEFSETRDGRYLISLSGICRFDVEEELELHSGGYRRVKANWAPYEKDLTTKNCLNLDRVHLKKLLEKYFSKQGMDC